MILGEANGACSDLDSVVELVCDLDDMSPEYVAGVAERARDAGALDVVLIPVTMKRGRPGVRMEVLSQPADAARLQEFLLLESTTIGVRSREARRRVLPREIVTCTVLGQEVRAKVVVLPNGARRAKPEFSDVQRIALETGRPLQDIYRLAAAAAERLGSA